MKAVVFESTRRVAVHDVPDARVQEPTDALLRPTSSALCGTDLHMFDGRTGAQPGLVFGHEPLGVIEEVGASVKAIRAGDRVVVPTHLFCGLCYNCARGNSAACLRVRPGAAGAAYGYAGMGPYPGALAERLRVPFADANCVVLPGKPGDHMEDDFVLLADAFVTGWHAAELAGVTAGSSVAVFGAGTIGLLAAYSAILRGASEVYVVDYIPERLARARELGATAIDFRQDDPVSQIRAHRRQRMGSVAPWNDEVMGGVMHAIDAVGFQARDRADPSRERPTQVIDDVVRVVNPTGHIGIIGVYAEHDLSPTSGGSRDGALRVPWASLFGKGVRVGLGRTHDRRYTTMLRDLVMSGRAHPGRIVSHHATLDEAPRYFQEFDRREAGVVKVVFRP
jgi:glutathione-independent formaldehyde dehydrogenase